jgi:hypothetical protein
MENYVLILFFGEFGFPNNRKDRNVFTLRNMIIGLDDMTQAASLVTNFDFAWNRGMKIVLVSYREFLSCS